VTADWTLDELVRRVADALAAEDVRAPNGRVRDVPDGRAIRWYTTIGLVDRPAGFRGRSALYGPRHLLQTVAVKRRQADGLPLAQIQAELAGATDATLRRVARLPDAALAGSASEAATPAGSYVAAPPASYVATPPPPVTAPSSSDGAAPVTAPPAPAVFRARSAASSAGAPPAGASRAEDRRRFWAAPPTPTATLRYRVALAHGVALDLPVAPSPRDLADIAAASAPLIRFLADRGLLTPEEPSE
jgi:DNA-binding transcriptional MerR regulator